MRLCLAAHFAEQKHFFNMALAFPLACFAADPLQLSVADVIAHVMATRGNSFTTGSSVVTSRIPKSSAEATNSRLRFRQLRGFEHRVEEAGFQRAIAVNGNGDDRALAGLAVDVVAALDALELPAVLLQQPADLFAAVSFHTATSSS